MRRGNNRNTKTKKAAAEKDEVEEMLQAAQDDLLLKLSVDSHMSHRRVSLDDDPDIDRRFHALKLKTTSGVAAADASAFNSKSNRTNSIQVDEEIKAVLGDDLSARFAALKSSLPTATATATRSSSSATTATSSYYYDDLDDEEDEVEKLMRWAKDAARLDPSPPSDSDDGRDKSESDDSDDDNKRKGNRIGSDCK
ncbi:uncharacterized protein [Pyrus communis]|uniref:uncharacterized protein n=1 Tax=Pyrus communis TaxID=23211 RepID=UPI0035C18AA0